MSNGKAYKGKYVYNSDGNLQFEKIGGGTIISAGGSGLVGDLTGSGNKTVPLVKEEDEMAGVAEAQAAEKARQEEAEKIEKQKPKHKEQEKLKQQDLKHRLKLLEQREQEKLR